MEEIIRQSGLIENDYVKKWKEEGGQVVGYICVATPTEIMEAAGILPYRIRALGAGQTDIADAHLSRFNCRFCRSCLQLGLEGTYDFLDGIIETNGCDHLRGMVENWDYVKKFSFFHYIRVPHVIDENSIKYFGQQLKQYKQAVEDAFGKAISDQEIMNQIKVKKRIRERLQRIYSMREQDYPAFTGAEVLGIYLWSTAAPSASVESGLDRIIEDRKDNEIRDYRARLLLAGSVTDEIDFVREIESMGGLVVADALCVGARDVMRGSEKTDADPYRDLSQSYFETLLCPRMYGNYASRQEFLFSTTARAKVDGVVLVHNKFCDIHAVDNVQLRIALEEKGTPVLQIEKEYGSRSDLGRMKTRVQAFLERIGGRQ